MGLWGKITGQEAAKKAAKSQERALRAAIEAQKQGAQDATSAIQKSLGQQRGLFGEQMDMLSPYMGLTEGAMGQMGAISGAQGYGAQQAAVNQIQNSPLFQAQVQQGENALLQNVSATGGLRGGDTQAALAQFRPQMLNQQINQQYQRLSGLGGLGMNAVNQASGAYGQMSGAYGQSGVNLANIQTGLGQAEAGALTGIGEAQAASDLAGYQLSRDFIFDLAGGGLQAAGLGIDAKAAGLF